MKVNQTIGLVRTPIGNLQSAYNAFYELGFDPIWVDSDFDAYDDISHLVVPGVGNFSAIMDHLTTSGLASSIVSFAKSGRPILGICVGMQVLASAGTESGKRPGLGLVQARVERLSSDPAVRLPHVGWNTVEIKRPHPVLDGIKPERDFYFVHSYGMTVEDDADEAGRTHYGQDFVSIVAHGNIIGCQFHPEKSQVNGLKILENFSVWDGKC